MGQLEAILQARATFSSQCKLIRKLVGGCANIYRPLWSLFPEGMPILCSLRTVHFSRGSQGKRERGLSESGPPTPGSRMEVLRAQCWTQGQTTWKLVNSP